MYQNIYYIKKENKVILFDDEKGMVDFEYDPYAYKRHDHGSYKSIYGDPLEKVYDFDTRYDDNLFESDVNPMTRTLIDLYENDDSVSKNHVIFNYDIEVGSEGGFAPADDTWQPITSIAFKDSVSQVRTVLILDVDGEVEDIEYDDELGPVVIRSFRDEKTLLLYFLQKYEEIRPTILTGWNITNFDTPYLYNRIKKVLGYKYAKRLSPIGVAFVSAKRLDSSFETTIAGVSSLDYLKLYKQFTYTELPNYRLGTVGLKEVGMDKLEYEGNLNHLFKTDINEFVRYNLTDVDIVDALDKKHKLIELAQAICHICHVPYEFIHFSSKFLEGALLTYLRRQGLVAPNKQKRVEKYSEDDEDDEDEDEGFKGAFVKEPKRAKYEWIFSNDINSLYPSAIRSLNISPETKVGKIINWEDVKEENVGETNRLIVDDTKLEFLNSRGKAELSKEELYSMLDKYNLSISSAGVIYSQDERGLLPSILDTWYADRKEFQRLKFEAGEAGDTETESFYDKRQHVQKILLNSLYGVLGLPVFRFYDLDNALSVTATGQDIIKATAHKSNETYKQILKRAGRESTDEEDFVIYIDTDSVYMANKPLVDALKLTDEQEMKELTIKVATNIVDIINEYYDSFMSDIFHSNNHVIKTAGETIGRTGIWLVKKRYCIHKIYDLEKSKDVDKFHIKGIDVVRSSFPDKFRRLMLDVDNKTGIIADLLLGADKSIVDEKILSFKREINSFPVAEVARNTSIKNISKYWDKKTEDKSISLKNLPLGNFPKIFKKDDGKTMGFPSHVKACINFNKLIKLKGLDKVVEPMFNGEKIKYVYLKRNEYGLEEMAFRGYHDPQFVLDFINKYYDGTELYNRELKNKIDDFYDAMKWPPATESDKILSKYFESEEESPYHKREKKKPVKDELIENKEVTEQFFGF